MVYCPKCGKKLSGNENFCSGCGNGSKKIKEKSNKLWIYLTMGVIVILILVFIVLKNPSNTGFSINNEKKVCNQQCCLDGKFQEKLCSQDYECVQNQCIAVDSDKDGLSDIEERNIGTNPQLFDTDGDTLSDYKEIKELATNPLNTNTDNDRYNDNLDKEPLKTNSAKVSVTITSQNWNFKTGNILSFLGGFINPNLVLAEPTATISVKNIGDDYTDYVAYDVFFKVSNVLVGTKNVRLDKIKPSEENTYVYTKQIIVGDLPDLLINLVSQQNADGTIEVGNINYENFY